MKLSESEQIIQLRKRINEEEESLIPINSKRQQRVLQDICGQYDRICEICGEEGINEFDVTDLLINSPLNRKGTCNDLLRIFQEQMFLLARRWDGKVNAGRSKEEEYGRHVFFLTYSRNKHTKQYMARAFNSHYQPPPDHRLVAITVPEDATEMEYMPLLHEMGHYIGGRDRKKRIRYLFNVALHDIAREIYTYCMNKYDGIPVNEQYLLYNNDKTMLSKERDVYEERLVACLKILHIRLTDGLSQTILYRPRMLQDKFAFPFLNKLMSAVSDNMKVDSFWSDYQQYIMENIEKCFRNHQTEDQILSVLSDIKNAGKDLFTVNDKIILREISLIIDYFEEPIADCFMIKIGGLSFQEYVSLLLNESWKNWKKMTETDPQLFREGFEEYINSKVMIIRILSIANAMRATEKEIRTWQISVGRRQRQIYRAKLMLARNYHEQQISIKNNEERVRENGISSTQPDYYPFKESMLNPQLIITDYITNLLQNHPHYKHHFLKSFPQIKIIRISKNSDKVVEKKLRRLFSKK